MLKELQEKKALLKKDADASKLERNRLNTEASQFAARRDELNAKTRALIDSAQQSRTSAMSTTSSFRRTRRNEIASMRRQTTCSRRRTKLKEDSESLAAFR